MLIGTVFLMLFLTCVKTAPEPRRTKLTFIRDSLLRYKFDAGNKKALVNVEGTRTIDIDLPDKTADKVPELTLLENVNSGAGIALEALDLDAIVAAKNKFLAGKFSFWRKR